MSNEMTDELRALDLIYHEVGDTKEARDAYEFLSARLRGEAVQQSVADTSTNETWIARAESKLAQGKQQAVAWVSPEQLDALRRGHDSVSAAPHKWRTDLQTVPLYTRPHPVAVAGDAMCVRCGDKPEGADSLNLTLSGLVTYGRVAANPAQGASRWHLMDLVRQMVPHLEAALSTQPAPSEQVAETDERMASMMEHGMAAWSVTPATKPEQLAASVPCAFRSLLAEARRQYRDSDAAGDVLAWLDERVLDVDHAASVAVPEGGRDA